MKTPETVVTKPRMETGTISSEHRELMEAVATGAHAAAPDEQGRRRPNPNSPTVQLEYAADFALRYLGHISTQEGVNFLAAVLKHDWQTILSTLFSKIPTDHELQRLQRIINQYKNAGEVRPFGYYATIAIANTEAGKETWEKDPEPWGTPRG